MNNHNHLSLGFKFGKQSMIKFVMFIMMVSALSLQTALAGLSGMWAVDCNDNKKSEQSSNLFDAFIVQRSHDEGEYQLSLCYGFKCTPMPKMNGATRERRGVSSIYNDPAFTNVSENKMTFRGKEYIKCSTLPELHFEPVKQRDIDTHLIGNWVITSEIINGKERPVNIHYNGMQWLISDTTITIDSQNDKLKREKNYVVKNAVISFISNKGEEKMSHKILKIDKERLYLSEINRPGEAIMIFERKP